MSAGAQLQAHQSNALEPSFFMAYSRRDFEFTDKLVSALTERGFKLYIDRQDILAGEDWERRLGTLIAGADSIILVLSPDAVSSDRILWELEEAERLGKRVLPVVYRRFDPSQAAARINAINWIFFDNPDAFDKSLNILVTALETDLPWIREHSRLLQRARRRLDLDSVGSDTISRAVS